MSAKALEFLNPAEMNPSPMYCKAALVGSNQVIFTGSQMAFHSTEEDVHLAFQRLAKVLEAAKSSMYSLSSALAVKIRDVRFGYYDKTRPPASTLLQFEGLPPSRCRSECTGVSAKDLARALATSHAEAGDATGWFEALYKQAAGNYEVILWADCQSNPHLSVESAFIRIGASGSLVRFLANRP